VPGGVPRSHCVAARRRPGPVSELAEAVGAALGTTVRPAGSVRGGISASSRMTTGDGTDVFVKHSRDGPAGMFPAEADGLAWLAGAGALRTPRVLAVRDDAPRFIVMEWIASGSPADDHDEQLGRGLAALHRAGAATFGYHDDNLIATLPQTNDPCPSWPQFYAERRIAPLARRAVDAGLIDTGISQRLDTLCTRLPELCGPDEPPSRLHGDLWGGNAMVDAAGMPVLIDPAVYAGHREVDLAMMRLFGGFGPKTFAAYHEFWPLADESSERVALFQLYPLLVHVLLFGGGYVAQLDRALSRYVRAEL
jgi:fructosamine-3-kinase